MQWNDQRVNKRRLAVTSFVLAGSLLLAACGGSDAGAAVTAAAEQPAAAASTEASAEATTEAITEATTEATAEATTEATIEATTGSTAGTAAKLNLNAVSGDELLAAIPNFGDRMVREFLEYRPYASIQQFRQEIGKYVDESQMAEYEQYVYVPVNVNEADAATLQQIPGVDAAAAAELAAGRPYASDAAFLEKLAQVAPQADAMAAAAYLEAK